MIEELSFMFYLNPFFDTEDIRPLNNLLKKEELLNTNKFRCQNWLFGRKYKGDRKYPMNSEIMKDMC